MRLKFFRIPPHHPEQRHGRNLSQSAERELDHVFRGPAQERKIGLRTAAEPNAIDHFHERRVPTSTRNALRARFDPAEGRHIASKIDDADGIVEHDEPARTEHPAHRGQRIEIDRHIELVVAQRTS